MSRTIELVVGGLDLDDDGTDELLAEKLSDFGWFSRDGLVTATIYLEAGDDSLSAACEAANRIENLTGARVEKLHEDLVGVSDTAARTGLHRETVRLLTIGKRGPGGFPQHVGTVGAGTTSTRVWRWHDVLPWLHEHYSLCLDEEPISGVERAQINAHLARVTHDFDSAWQTTQNASGLRCDVRWQATRIAFGETTAWVSTHERLGTLVAAGFDRKVMDDYVFLTNP